MAFGFGFGFSRLYGALAAAFSPAALFAAGEQGTWYDPSDYGVNGTLFQDSAGTTPVTAVQQPVGLMLDKSKGLVLGPERVTNGNFSNGTTEWAPRGSGGTTTLTVVNNVLEITGSASFASASQVLPLVIGRTYVVTADIWTSNAARSVKISIVNNAATIVLADGALVTSTTPVKVQLVFTATETNSRIDLYRASASTDYTGFFDNISVKELPGNHAFQTTSASRPVLSARYNLLTKTEQFDDAVWGKASGAGGSTPVVTSNYGTAPDGTQTADRIQLAITSTANSFSQVLQSPAVVVGVSYAYKVWLKSLSGTPTVDLGRLGGSYGVFKPTLTTSWVEYAFTFTATSTNETSPSILLYQATGTSTSADILAWGADLRVSNDALGQPAYQRVNTATDYDTVGFKPYLAFDGVDDSLVTNSIDFTATDKMTVFAGVRKLSDAATGLLVGNSASPFSNNGIFEMFAPGSAGTTYGWRSKGTIDVLQVPGTFAAPISSVLTGVGNISGDIATLRVNSTQVATSTADQGTGNYGNYPLYIGRRDGGSLPFNGRLYSLIVRGAASTTAQITSTETYVAGKTGVTLPVTTFDFITTDIGDQIVTDDGDSVITDTYFA